MTRSALRSGASTTSYRRDLVVSSPRCDVSRSGMFRPDRAIDHSYLRIVVVKSAAREDLICIFQKTTTITKNYIGADWNHFLPSLNDKNRNTAKLGFRFHLTGSACDRRGQKRRIRKGVASSQRP